MSSGWVLTLTPAAARTGAERLGLGPDGFMELTGEILSVCDVGTRVGSMRDSERDRLPEWFFVLQDLPSTGVVIPEVHVPMTLEVALACAFASKGVFRLYYTSASEANQSLSVWISDSFGNEQKLDFEFNVKKE